MTDTSKSFKFPTPKQLFVGDIVDYEIKNSFHPAIVINIIGENCHCIVLSSKDRNYCTLSKVEESRIFFDSYFTCTIAGMTTEYALTRWRGIFDNLKEIKRIKKLLKEHYKNILK